MSKQGDAIIHAYNTGYRVAPDGTYVLSPSGGRLVGFDRSKTYPYKCFCIRLNDYPRLVPFHSLQAYQKYGDKSLVKGIHVRHRDNNSHNNSWDNILLGSPSENQLDREPMDRRNHALHAAKKLRRFSIEQVRDMRNMRNDGVCLRVIGEKYGIRKGHVSDLVNNKFYKETLA